LFAVGLVTAAGAEPLSFRACFYSGSFWGGALVLRADTWVRPYFGFIAAGIVSLSVVILILSRGVGEARGNGIFYATKEC
tara:strand:- start:92314 stop:92553 length:240 start_codon:yes stop_codon:yes gene_type:complete